MPHFHTSRLVHHSAEKMYALVADVERYPEFVPLCQNLSVRGRELQADGTEILVADMSVAYGPVRETFVTRVVLNRPALTIDATYLEGPFSHLDNQWSFIDRDNAGTKETSTVNFKIDYEFKSRTLGLLMGSMFDRAFRKFAEAFEDRADTVYQASSARQD
uniref:type II toxin-antitoxin system RatA family toxin n=1 Tax=Pararhizobium sp. IMCC3301 TaxID=3067904 RepID=UPI0027425CC2|nr:type II toxin-antitoxin system RatA family toxin [Pararhizobium sp. IMCC3301]